jgi:hypothetical protein
VILKAARTRAARTSPGPGLGPPLGVQPEAGTRRRRTAAQDTSGPKEPGMASGGQGSALEPDTLGWESPGAAPVPSRTEAGWTCTTGWSSG